jgi:hypothetical protein
MSYYRPLDKLKNDNSLLNDKNFIDSLEKNILNNSKNCYLYAKHYIKGRWEKGEETILTDKYSALGYATLVLKDRWPEAENILKKSPETAVGYSSKILKARWPEAEEIILKDLDNAIAYTKKVIREPWPELEKLFLKKIAFNESHRGMFLKIERYIKRVTYLHEKYGSAKTTLGEDLKNLCKIDLELTKSYMNHFNLTVFPEAEPFILKSAKSTIWYAIRMKKTRWPEAEVHLISSARTAYDYAYILKGRFEAGEEIIMKDTYFRKAYLDHLAFCKNLENQSFL